jgi:hypothetical protein
VPHLDLLGPFFKIERVGKHHEVGTLGEKQLAHEPYLRLYLTSDGAFTVRRLGANSGSRYIFQSVGIDNLVIEFTPTLVRQRAVHDAAPRRSL